MKRWSNFVFFFTVLPAILRAEPIQVDDFDKLIRDFGNGQAGSGNSVAWSDAYMKNGNLLNRPDKSHCKIAITTDKMTYLSPLAPITQPEEIHTETYTNDASYPKPEEFTKEVELKTSYTWKSSTHLGIGSEVTISAGFPGVADVSGKFGTSFDLTKGSAKTDTRTEKTSKTIKFEVEPRKRLSVDISKVEQQMDIPWEAPIIITGYVAISYEHEHQGWFLHCYPVRDLAKGRFKYSPEHDGLLYKARGILTSVKGSKTIANFRESDL